MEGNKFILFFNANNSYFFLIKTKRPEGPNWIADAWQLESPSPGSGTRKRATILAPSTEPLACAVSARKRCKATE
jgi:hypothetical protein